MAPDQALSEAAHRADHARRLLDDPMLAGALAAHRDAIRSLVFSLPIEAREQREFLVMQDKARQAFEHALVLNLYDHQILQPEYLMETNLQVRREAIERHGRER